jgi:hypothetical protein
MIAKSGHRFSEKIMLQLRGLARNIVAIPALAPFWTVPQRASITPRALHRPASGGFGAQVAQLVEHVTENHGVGGSIPPLGTTIKSSAILRNEAIGYILAPNS